jgi:hypothetical protein
MQLFPLVPSQNTAKVIAVSNQPFNGSGSNHCRSFEFAVGLDGHNMAWSLSHVVSLLGITNPEPWLRSKVAELWLWSRWWLAPGASKFCARYAGVTVGPIEAVAGCPIARMALACGERVPNRLRGNYAEDLATVC